MKTIKITSLQLRELFDNGIVIVGKYKIKIRWIMKVQLFDSEYCEKIECSRYSYWFGGICYGMPETCKENKKNGYPKEIKEWRNKK